MVSIFLSYTRRDEKPVAKLYQTLLNEGFSPWMDKNDILPGEVWEQSIKSAIRRADFFFACLSGNSVNRRGFVQKEIHNALEIWQEKLDGDIYLIPVRLASCEVPESLCKFQCVDLFDEKFGLEKLMKAMQIGMDRRAEVKQSVLDTGVFDVSTTREDSLRNIDSITLQENFKSKTKVELTIDLEFSQFDIQYRTLLQNGLAVFLGISPKAISITSVDS